MTPRTLTNFWIDLGLLIVMIGMGVTGGILHFVLPPGTGRSRTLLGLGRHDFSQIHFCIAALVIALLAVHLLLHWKWIYGVVGQGRWRPLLGLERESDDTSTCRVI